MMTPFKWLFVSITFILLVLGVAYAGSMQNSNTRTTAEAEALADTVLSGLLRGELNEQGILDRQMEYVSMDEIVVQLTNSLAFAQKTHPYAIEMRYVFLDDDKKVTTDDKKVKMLHFEVTYKNEEGIVKGTAERTLALNQFRR